jgi:hypothetical protein
MKQTGLCVLSIMIKAVAFSRRQTVVMAALWRNMRK